MPKLVALKRGQEQEMLQLYQRGDATVTELAETYSVSTSWIYRLFERNGVKPHRGVVTKGTPVPEETEVPQVHTNSQLEVVVDGQGTVQSVTRPTAKQLGLSTWEIKYTGTIMVDAGDVDEAIREARKVGMVKRIYSVRVKAT